MAFESTEFYVEGGRVSPSQISKTPVFTYSYLEGSKVMQKSQVRLLVFAILLIALLSILAAPTDIAVADDAKPPFVRLTIINNSQFDFSLVLYGPDQYNFSIPAHSDGSWIVKRGMYSSVMRACNISKVGTLDMSIFQIIHVPVCGGNAGAKGDKHHHIDVADYIKPVKIKIRNKTSEPIGLYIRTLERHFFLNLEPNEIQYLILPKDQYVYSYVVCEQLVSGYYSPKVTPPFDLKCPTK